MLHKSAKLYVSAAFLVSNFSCILYLTVTNYVYAVLPIFVSMYSGPLEYEKHCLDYR